MFGLNNLFWYYSKSVRSKVEVPDGRHDDDDSSVQAGIYFGTYV